jgi:hypothetical protein
MWKVQSSHLRARALSVALAVPVRLRTGSFRVLKSHGRELRIQPCCSSNQLQTFSEINKRLPHQAVWTM